GLIYLWTGEGAGKSTSAFGTALRAIGHKKKVVIIQFLKGRKDVGEYKVAEQLKPYYEIHQFGRPEFIDLKNPTDKDKELAQRGLEFAKKVLEQKPFLLILDEINLAVAHKLLETKDILELLNSAPEETTIYLTGRHAPNELLERADVVNEIKVVKFPKDIKTLEGIQY
ncbi:cob(I)yrinic acid a,c-diamide adenosyltransferase, partial [Candidatus Woesearchaeota archaeon]|nr:cob(I)yrinic acid a,c-diamide adenosyltransferase [Candidatus Woesearchaeota archaeon]